MKIPHTLNVGHKVKTDLGKWKIIAINDDIASILVDNKVVNSNMNELVHIKSKKEEYSNESYLDKVVLEHPDWRKFVSSKDRETYAWNITGSTKLDDNLEVMWFLQWIQKICFAIWVKHNIQLPDFTDHENYQQEFADRATDIWQVNMDSLISFILASYHRKFDDKDYPSIWDDMYEYQFAKIINAALQMTQMAKYELSLDIFRLNATEIIKKVKAHQWWIPLVVSSAEGVTIAINNILAYVIADQQYKSNLN